jgi:hypothetical protein
MDAHDLDEMYRLQALLAEAIAAEVNERLMGSQRTTQRG